jgi:restriction endonuclease S subunit
MSKKNTTYKQSAIGLIPSDWEVKSVENCFEILDNKRKPLNNNIRNTMKGMIPYYGANGVVDYINDFLFDEDLILIAEDGGYFDEYQTRPIAYKISGKSWVNNHAHILKAKNKNSQEYLFYTLEHKNILDFLNGGTRAKLNKGELEKILVPFPSLEEQNNISMLLSTWDNAIKVSNDIISNLEVIKKNITINILSGKSKFNNPKATTKKDTLAKNNKIAKWEVKQIATVVKQIKNPVKVELTKAYRQLGIRSHTKGIFYKEPVSGLILGNKSVFYVESNCFIVNIVFAWEHAIAKTTDNEIGFIVSHRFPMYKPLPDILDLDYLLYFFKSKKGKDLLGLASPGGAGRNKTLGQKEFLNLKIPVPPLEEQKKIATFLSSLDRELELHKQKLQTLQLQKKGLMQQLLTGKIRVK